MKKHRQDLEIESGFELRQELNELAGKNPMPTSEMKMLDGPLQPWFTKTWRPGDPELVKWTVIG